MSISIIGFEEDLYMSDLMVRDCILKMLSCLSALVYIISLLELRQKGMVRLGLFLGKGFRTVDDAEPVEVFTFCKTKRYDEVALTLRPTAENNSRRLLFLE